MTITIAIDGPAASGKSHTASTLAKILGYERIDSGLLYRAVTFLTARHFEVDADALNSVSFNLQQENIKNFVLSLSFTQKNGIIYYNGEDITKQLRTHEVDSMVGKVARELYIREKIHDIQKEMVKNIKNGVIIDGRDIGTVVLPNASLKLFITAKDTTRAERRANETGKDYNMVLEELKKRDFLDVTREHGPLKMADDAILIENDSLTLQETVEKVLTYIKKLESKN